MPSETILAVSQSGLGALLQRDGFHSMNADQIASLFAGIGLWLGPREQLENNPVFRQIIPYTVILAGRKVLAYTRAGAGSERRLHGRRSLGIGGHVDLRDLVHVGGRIDVLATMHDAATREVREEIGDIGIFKREWLGILLDDASEVGRVHVGVACIWSVDAASGVSTDLTVECVSFADAEELNIRDPNWERWSSMLVPVVQKWIQSSEA